MRRRWRIERWADLLIYSVYKSIIFRLLEQIVIFVWMSPLCCHATLFRSYLMFAPSLSINSRGVTTLVFLNLAKGKCRLLPVMM